MSTTVIGFGGAAGGSVLGAATVAVLPQTGILPQTGAGTIVELVAIAAGIAIVVSLLSNKLFRHFGR
jgi:hypothetical protein